MGLWVWRNKESVKEAKKQVWLGGPMICVCVFQYSLQMVSLMFVGHLGEIPLSGASMATSFLNATGFYLLVRNSHTIIDNFFLLSLICINMIARRLMKCFLKSGVNFQYPC